MADLEQVVSWQSIARPDEQTSVCFHFNEMLEIDGDIRSFESDGFAISVNGDIRVYKNKCPHAGSPLDWLPGQFFSEDGKQLVCHTHDARFDPLSGACLSGPCPHGLDKLPSRFREDSLERESILEVPACLQNT